MDNMGPFYGQPSGNRGLKLTTPPHVISFFSSSVVNQTSPLSLNSSLLETLGRVRLEFPTMRFRFWGVFVFILAHLPSSPRLYFQPVDRVLLCPDTTACNSQTYVRLIDCFFSMSVNRCSRLHQNVAPLLIHLLGPGCN